jgi:hypothetical protein
MSVVGVPAGDPGESHDSITVDANKASGGSHAAAFLEMFEHREGLFFGEMAAIQRGALALGEAGAAGVAVELPELIELAVAAADREVADIALTIELAFRILAAEAGEVIHKARGLAVRGQDAIRGWNRRPSTILRPIPRQCSTCLGHHRTSTGIGITPYHRGSKFIKLFWNSS